MIPAEDLAFGFVRQDIRDVAMFSLISSNSSFYLKQTMLLIRSFKKFLEWPATPPACHGHGRCGFNYGSETERIRGSSHDQVVS
jgi:hypothetical protein